MIRLSVGAVAVAAGFFAGTLALGWVYEAATVREVSPPAAVVTVDRYAWEVGDDNGDGLIMEDESGWNCSTMGNGICGSRIPSPEWFGPVQSVDRFGYEPDTGAYVGGYN